ncbi:hypothetical protein KSS87_017907 [Heliosperma pusillum]|nr:hypothetical protein KSS87_017907 [Heliosperma pusillum]
MQVVNDGDMFLWRELGVNSWPTFTVIGPTGKIIAQISGEGRRKDLDDIVEAALVFYGKRKMLDDSALPLRLEKDNDPRLLTSPLKFPGKLAVDILNKRLFISDSNHNRIVVTDLDGNYITQVGSSGEEGLRDGNFDDATFNRPQGLAYNTKRNVLYVADTENHALREVDFVTDMVRTLAGNGSKGSDYKGGGIGKSQASLRTRYSISLWPQTTVFLSGSLLLVLRLLSHLLNSPLKIQAVYKHVTFFQLLNSPWDVCFDATTKRVYIAMAGQHQIWEHDLENASTTAFSGDGYERNLNGSSATSTSYAQPSGMSFSSDMKEIYIADSESSSIRALDLKTGGSRLLAGGDPIFPDNLFKYGDHDGIGSEVLLQHPLGVCFAQDGQVYIADSYNHKVKKLDPSNKRVTTLAGIGKAGFKDGKALAAQLSEPSGLVDAGNGKLFIADTNNNVIRYMDLNNGEPVLLTLELKGVHPPAPRTRTMKRLRKRVTPDTQIIKVSGSQSNEGNLDLRISLPSGYHFSKLDMKLSISLQVYYCKVDEVCLYQSLAFEVPFKEGILEADPNDVTLQYDVKPKDTRDTSMLPATL